MRKLVSVLLSVALLAACGGGGAGESSTTTAEPTTTAQPSGSSTTQTTAPVLEEGPLVVGIWGGVWETAIGSVLDDFKNEYGVDVVLDISSSADRVAKLQLTPDALDVAFLTPEAMASAELSGLLTHFAGEEVPGTSSTVDSLISGFTADDGFFAVPVSWTASGILYREDLVPFEITSIADLWRPELENRVAIQHWPSLGAANFLIEAAHAFGGSQENLEPGWDALANLAPNINHIYQTSSTSLDALVAGDIWALPTIASQGIPLADKNVKVVLSEDGVTYSIQAAAVTAGSQRPNLAKAFLDYLLRPEVQAVWAENGRAAPGTNDVPLSEEAQQYFLETPEVIENLIALDFIDIASHMEEWTERFNREVTR